MSVSSYLRGVAILALAGTLSLSRADPKMISLDIAKKDERYRQEYLTRISGNVRPSVSIKYTPENPELATFVGMRTVTNNDGTYSVLAGKLLFDRVGNDCDVKSSFAHEFQHVDQLMGVADLVPQEFSVQIKSLSNDDVKKLLPFIGAYLELSAYYHEHELSGCTSQAYKKNHKIQTGRYEDIIMNASTVAPELVDYMRGYILFHKPKVN